MKCAPARRAAALAISLALGAPLAHAAGLGRLSVQSALGQPLSAEVQITSVTRDEGASLAVRLAPQSAFKQANLDFNPALSALRFKLERSGDQSYVVRITSLAPINEPFLDLLVELSWSTGRVLREYTVLLDPPALRQTTPIIPAITASAPSVESALPEPVVSAPPPVAVPVTESAPTPQPVAQTAQTAEPQPVAQVAPEPPPPQPVLAQPQPQAVPTPVLGVEQSSTDYTVKRGDTLGKIAMRHKSADVSLDQMLVALFRANPNAFIGDNMNRIMAGRTITVPGHDEAKAIAATEARQEVVAHSADFAQYRSRLAQAAVADVPTVEQSAGAAGRGQITTKVEDQGAPVIGADQLKIAKVDAAQSGGTLGASTQQAAEAQKADEAIAAQRALQEQQERAAELAKANALANRALELQSKTGAQAQKAAETQQAAPVNPTTVEPEPIQTAEPVVPPAVSVDQNPESDVAQQQATVPVEATPQPPVVEPEPAPEPVPPAVVAQPPVTQPSQPAAPSFIDELLSQTVTLVLLGALAVGLVLLVAMSAMRRRRVEKKEDFQATGENYRGNTFFGATGGQSVDTSAASAFNSSFIPAASQLDSNEVDPVAEADVYIAYGREEQAEDILREALRVQPDRHPVRIKLLEIYARRGDVASFNASFEELRERTGSMGEEWERALRLGRSLDPANPVYAEGGSAGAAARGPTTELRLNPGGQASGFGGLAVGSAAGTIEGAPSLSTASAISELDAMAAYSASPEGMPSSQLSVDSQLHDTAMPETQMTADTHMPDAQDTYMEPASTVSGPTTKFEATLSTDESSGLADTDFGSQQEQPQADLMGTTTNAGIDFGSLDFDLGSTKLDVPTTAKTTSSEPPALGGFDLPQTSRTSAPPTLTTPSMLGAATVQDGIPDVDLNIPTSAAGIMNGTTGTVRTGAGSQTGLEEALSRPSLLGEVGALPGEGSQRLTSNTDQATVPLIDFDLSGADVDLPGRRTETQAGTPLAGQMATKLDLARGYIDLGVKDGARELLEEVMREGTRDQRQSAVDLLKQVEA